jgi:diaminopimelate epimerase
MRFAKGHGTENDFVILPDPGSVLDLRPELVARICDRRAGIGGDGVLRVMPASGRSGRWFMDYRNADGSIAETCGNGIRVFARYLLDSGLAVGPELAVETRAGVRQVRIEPDGRISADMGLPELLGPGSTRVGDRECTGLRMSIGNPHLACLVDAPVEEFDLSVPPVLDPAQFPDGGNVELVRLTAPGSVTMRVRERGSGETRSCGTGAVAAAAAAAHAAGDGSAASAASAASAPGALNGTWRVSVPGGQLTVTLDGKTSWLTGPAVIVAEGEISDGWLR